MPKQIARHKELLNELFVVQNKMDDLCEKELLNDEAFRQLSETNMEVYKKIENMLKNMIEIKEFYIANIRNSRWVHHHIDGTYHQRQCKNREHKMKNSHNYLKCDCGDFISKDFYKQHLKTEKHNSSMVRIDVEKSANKVLNPYNLSTLLLISSQVNSLKNSKKHSHYVGNVKLLGMPRLNWLEMWIKRYKLRQLN